MYKVVSGERVTHSDAQKFRLQCTHGYKNGRWYTPDLNEYIITCSMRYSPDIHVHIVTRVAHGTHQTTRTHYSHVSICPTIPPRLVCRQRIIVQTYVARKWGLASHLSAANHSSAKCFLTCPKGWKSPSTVVGVTHNLPALPRRDKAGWPYGVQWLTSSQKTYRVCIMETKSVNIASVERKVAVNCDYYRKQI